MNTKWVDEADSDGSMQMITAEADEDGIMMRAGMRNQTVVG